MKRFARWRANTLDDLAATLTVLIGMFFLGSHLLGSGCSRGRPRQGESSSRSTSCRRRAAAVNAVVRLESNPRVKPDVRDEVSTPAKAKALSEMTKRYPEIVRSSPGNPLPATIDVTPLSGRGVRKSDEPERRGRSRGREREYGEETAERILQRRAS